MEQRLLATLVALFFLLLPLPIPPNPSPLLLHHHLLLSSQIAATTALARKRKRHQQDEDAEDEDGEDEEEEDDDEEEEEELPMTVVPTANPDPYKHTFMMSSSTFDYLSGLLDPLLDCRDPLGSPLLLPGPTRLAIALSRLSLGLPYPSVAVLFSVPLPSARFCSRHLCRVLTTNFRFFLSPPPSPPSPPLHPLFPSARAALSLARFPPSSSALLLSDSSSRILSLSASSSSSSNLFARSSLRRRPPLLAPGEFIVARAGPYPLLPWLMLPFPGPLAPASPESAFNAAHRRMCRPARRAAASLGNWGVTRRLAEEDAKTAAACVGACAILHNVMLTREDYSALAPEAEDEDEEEDAREGLEVEEWGVVDEDAVAVRRALAARAHALSGGS